MAAIGVQEPRIVALPPSVSTEWGDEAIELAESAGLILDPWQRFVIKCALATREDGKFVGFEVGLNVARQNGKGAILEALELWALFRSAHRMIVHSAHQFDTSLEHFRRLTYLIEDTPELMAQVKPRGFKYSHGEEGIELRDGSRLRFRTRTKGGGRGFSGDLVVLDEAMELSTSAIGALLPTVRARPNPQIWYAGSAVDQNVHEHGLVWARVRERGHEGSDPRLAYFEWSAEGELADASGLMNDRRAWAQANPGLGIRIDEEHVEAEARSLDPRTFAVELLGIGDWPVVAADGLVISAAAWLSLVDPVSEPDGSVWLAFDVAENRSVATICAAGRRADGMFHVEVVDQGGTDWLPGRLAELERQHQPEAILYDGRGPAASLEKALENAEVSVKPMTSSEHAQACGVFFDAVAQRTLRHLGTADLVNAIKGADRRPMGDAWAWSRKSSAIDISPLVAATLALWGSVEEVSSDQQSVWVFG